jgi:PDZ domain
MSSEIPRASVPVAETATDLLLGRVPFVLVAISGHDSLNTILDTGANDDIVNARVVRDIGLTVHNPQRVEQPGGAIEMGAIDTVRIEINSATVNLPMVSAPLDPLQRFIGRRFDAILGHGFFQHYVVELDYSNARIRLYDPRTYEAPKGYVSLPITFRDKSPLVEVAFERADGSTLRGWLELDTGSFESLGLKGRFVESNALVPNGAVRLPLFGLAIGGQTSGYRTRLKAFTLGPFRFASPVASVTTSANADTEGSDVAGVLGGEALNRFMVAVDYSRNRLLLRPNEHYGAPSEYFDCLGVQVVAEGDQLAQFVISAVMPNSPASDAGLKAGDEIVDIDGRPAERLKLDDVITAFGVPAKRHGINIARSDERMSVNVVTRRLV